MLDSSVCSIAGEIACFVQASTRLIAKGMGNKSLSGQLRTVQEPASQPVSSDVEFTWNTNGNQLQLRVKDV